MGTGKVYDVEVVANGRSVACRVIIAVHLQGSAQARSALRDERDKVLGHAQRQLTDAGGRVRSDGIEVAQDDDLEAECANRVAQHFFTHLLGVAVRRFRGFDGRGFRNGKFVGLAINRGRGAENESTLGMSTLVIQKIKQGIQVVPVVGDRLSEALPYRFVGGKVNDPVEAATCQKGFGGGAVCKVDLDPLGADAGNSLDAVKHFGTGVVEIVGQDHVVSTGDQVDGGVRANESEASSNEDGFHFAVNSEMAALLRIEQVVGKQVEHLVNDFEAFAKAEFGLQQRFARAWVTSGLCWSVRLLARVHRRLPPPPQPLLVMATVKQLKLKNHSARRKFRFLLKLAWRMNCPFITAEG